ncbi:MAG: xanthine dehydrogenase family protein molybdopterin-binding subunit [Actinomycetota bacterium]
MTGAGRFIADLVRPGMLHAAFVRSPFPHALFGSIDTSRALALPGVHAVLTAADFPADLPPQPTSHPFPGQRETPYFALARDRVRYAGEPVAMVVAESPYLAEDGRDEVDIDWEMLPSVGDTEAAVAEGAPRLYDDWPDNVAATFETEMGDVDAAFAQADVVVRERFRIGRMFGCPLEGRGVLAEWDGQAGELTVWTPTQTLHIVRDFLAKVLGIPEHRIRVLVPRIGGAFGAKFHFYPEEVAIALAARHTGRPVRWAEDRSESFLSTVHAREQVIEAEMAARSDGRITGVRADILGDMGAALHTVSWGPVWLTSVMMTNAYEIPNARVRMRAVVTNKTPLGSYRGWGQPQANFVVERLVDKVADSLGMDPTEVRRTSFIPPDRFPYQGLHHVFDSGRYANCLDRALELSDYEGWRARQAEYREAGRHVGVGVSFYVENTALGPSRILNAGGVEQGGYDIGHVRVEPGGQATVYTGLCDMGQGITNALAQVCADQLGIEPDRVAVVTGDTHLVPYTGYGTGASRSIAVGGASVMKACGTLRAKIVAIAAHMLEVDAADVELAAGAVSVKGAPERFVTMADIGRAAYLRPIELPEGMDPGLEAIEVFDPPQMAWPYGTNVVVVEVDPETGAVSFLDYTYVHDCGTVVNPMIVEGQIHGGVAQGIGEALFEELRYGDDGQPLFGSFMDYVLPTAAEVPRLRLDHQVTPSPHIPGGTKGVGEAGAIGSPAAVVAAVEDALRPFDVSIADIPVTPDRILSLLRQAEGEPVAARGAER